MAIIGISVTSVTSVTDEKNKNRICGSSSTENIIAEWHRDTDRTFSIDEVKRWFKIARPLSEAARRE